mmetsp:Transcript_29293/g.97383  ORF Transcript_29293/g.97383 Transcript_29293/m.97383 type:complete len:206 (+) Transcript_29293:1577-2194(+)
MSRARCRVGLTLSTSVSVFALVAGPPSGSGMATGRSQHLGPRHGGDRPLAATAVHGGTGGATSSWNAGDGDCGDTGGAGERDRGGIKCESCCEFWREYWLELEGFMPSCCELWREYWRELEGFMASPPSDASCVKSFQSSSRTAEPIGGHCGPRADFLEEPLVEPALGWVVAPERSGAERVPLHWVSPGLRHLVASGPPSRANVT